MSGNATVTVGEILELRGGGLSEEEVWSLLCQAVQTLQDLFLCDAINQDHILPLLTPQNLEICSKGKVVISYCYEIRESDKQYLCPEFDKAKNEGPDFDWEKMWVYSLGKALLSSLSVAHADGIGSLGPVLGFMTKTNPAQRASLMSLLNVISEHCKTNLPSKPFSYLVIDMYREVFGTPTQCLSTPNCSILSTASHVQRATAASTPAFITLDSAADSGLKRNPVQRAPSRLYRAPVKPDETREVCVGPEFVVRCAEMPKTVRVGEGRSSRTVTVVLLTGVRVLVECDPHTVTAGNVFEAIAQLERLEDNYVLGLACTMNGDFVFVPPEMKLRKLAPNGWKTGRTEFAFLLFLRVRFFLPNLRGIRNRSTKHLLYLQLRRSLIEQQIKCEAEELLELGGLALQAEFGDYLEREHGSSSYFLLEHYLPEELVDERVELERQLQELHKSRAGLKPDRAEEIFVARTQRLPEYGCHHYTAEWVRKSVRIPMWVTINPQGVFLYEKKANVLDRKIHEAFAWKNIRSLKCNEQYFYIVPHDIGKQKLTNYKLRMDNKKSFFVFRLASFHHQFYLKLRLELSSLHSLSLEFGVPVSKEEAEEKENRKNRCRERVRRNEALHQRKGTVDKENENPTEKKEKRKGVKMGVRAFQNPEVSRRRASVSSNGSWDAYVLDSSIKSSDEAFTYDLQETIPSALADRFDNVQWEDERELRKVRLKKDRYGSFGLEVAEGGNGGVFVENVLKAESGNDAGAVRRGDQLIAVNGLCLLNLNYADALGLLRSTGSEMEVLVSRTFRKEEKKIPVECEYMRSIRFDIAQETDGCETKVVADVERRRQHELSLVPREDRF